MSQSSKSGCDELNNRLRATAPTFTPAHVQGSSSPVHSVENPNGFGMASKSSNEILWVVLTPIV